MNAIYPGFPGEYLPYYTNQILPPYNNKINGLEQNIIMSPFVTRVTFRKQMMTHVQTSDLDVSILLINFIIFIVKIIVVYKTI